MMEKRKDGMALPMLLTVVGVVALIGGALVTVGVSSLTTTKADMDAESAFYAAEAGLAAASEELYRKGEVPQPYQNKLASGACYQVQVFENATGNPYQVPEGPKIPPNTSYLLATGVAPSGKARKVGALFRSGLGAFQVGALANDFIGENSEFDAYDSNLEPSGYTGADPAPQSLVADAGILATNNSTGLAYQFTNSNVKGGIFVGPGGSKTLQISNVKSTIQREAVLAKPVAVPTITVPSVGTAGSTDGTAEGDAAAAPKPYTMAGTLNIAPPVNPGDPVTFTQFCLTVKVWDDGRFIATEGGSSTTIKGNYKTGTIESEVGASSSVTFNPFHFSGLYHQLVLDTNTGQISTEMGDSTIAGAHTQLTSQPMPGWLASITGASSGPPSKVNPAELEGGRYDKVTVNGGATTRLKDNSVIVMNDLDVSNMGKLSVAGAGNVSIYVTGSLRVSGKDSILNSTRRAPKLRIYYTGTSPVEVSGGSEAFFTLLAPDAPILLEGHGAAFYGAAVGKSLAVKNAKFHFDTATEGVGTGIDGSALTLLARQRL